MTPSAPDLYFTDVFNRDGDLPKTVPVGKQHLLEFFEKYVEEPFKKLADGPTMDPSLAAAVKLIARDLEEDLQGFQTRASERLHSSHNRRMVGTGPAMENLRNTIETEGRYPTQTPGDALLCGAHALAMDLNDLRSYSTTQQRQAWFGVDPPARFTADELMRLLFRNYDPSNRSAEPSLGVPTDDYPDYLNDLNLDGLGAAGVRERRRMLSMNNLHFAQLQAIMRMLYYAGRIKGGFGLGVVTGNDISTISSSFC